MRILERPRVPFKRGQNADFFAAENLHELQGFNLRITLPKEPYWRCGFVLAPESYIRNGRSDVTITQYFLFHVGQGESKAPQQPTGLRYQVYEQEITAGPRPFSSDSPVEVDVRVGMGSGHVGIRFGAESYGVDLDPRYFRNLYVLAWADNLLPFRVPIELTLR